MNLRKYGFLYCSFGVKECIIINVYIFNYLEEQMTMVTAMQISEALKIVRLIHIAVLCTILCADLLKNILIKQ